MARSARPRRAGGRASERTGVREPGPAPAFVTDSTRRRRWPRGLKGQQRRRPRRRLREGCPRPGARPPAPCALPTAPSSHDPAPFRPAAGLLRPAPAARRIWAGGTTRGRTSLKPPRASAPGPPARHVRGLSRRPRRLQQEARGPLEVAPPRGCPRATHSPGLGAARMGRGGMPARLAASPLLLSLSAEPPTTFLSVAPERSFSPHLCSLLRSRLPEMMMMEPACFCFIISVFLGNVSVLTLTQRLGVLSSYCAALAGRFVEVAAQMCQTDPS